MKGKETFSVELSEHPYYLTLERFAELIGMADQLPLLENWIDAGALPMRQFGEQRLVDLRALLERQERSEE